MYNLNEKIPVCNKLNTFEKKIDHKINILYIGYAQNYTSIKGNINKQRSVYILVILLLFCRILRKFRNIELVFTHTLLQRTNVVCMNNLILDSTRLPICLILSCDHDVINVF